VLNKNIKQGGKMQYMNKVLALILFRFGFVGMHAQQNFTGAGGEASGLTGAASYSMGQLVYTTNTGTAGSVSQGVQQPYEIYMTSVNDIKDVSLICSTYPNPTSNVLILVVKNSEMKDCHYQFLDMNGKQILNNTIVNAETQIPMSKLLAGIYFLKVYNENKEVKTFKIVKN